MLLGPCSGHDLRLLGLVVALIDYHGRAVVAVAVIVARLKLTHIDQSTLYQVACVNLIGVRVIVRIARKL